MLKQKLSTPLIILLIIVSFGAHKLIYELLQKNSHVFTINKINVVGATLSRDVRFEQILTSATNSVNDLIDFDIRQLKYQLEKLDLVKQATVQRDLPTTLSIQITERQPVAILKTKSTNYTIDNEGVVLALIPNIAIPTLKIEYGLAMNNNQIVDEFLLQILPKLVSDTAKNLQEIRINKNRKTFFKIYNTKPEFAIDSHIINDEYISKAQKISHTLTNKQLKTPKTIDIHSYKDRSIGFY